MKIPRHIWIPLAVLWIAVMAIEGEVIRRTGRVIYPLDDPYIHLAMARHFAADAVFGVSLDGFSATSSSPGWTLLLGVLFLIFGSHAFVPLMLNLLAASLLLVWISRTVFCQTQNSALALGFSIFFLFALPLPTMVCTGMEHPLHIGLVLLLVTAALRGMDRPTVGKEDASLFALAAAAAMIRYETLFLVAPLAVLSVASGRWKRAAILLLGAGFPLGLIGILNRYEGWYFFPNSILLKSALNMPRGDWVMAILIRFKNQLTETAHLWTLILLGSLRMVSLLSRPITTETREWRWGFAFLFTAMLHGALALTGWFYRYEGYLLALGMVALVGAIPACLSACRCAWHGGDRAGERILARGGMVALLLLALIPFWNNFISFRDVLPGVENVFQQQYQMGRFLRAYYNGATVAANDIGAINYLADLHCMDLVGLGSVEPIKASKQRLFNEGFVESWARLRDAKIAVIYENWWRHVIPATWTKVGEWTVPRKATAGDATVAFFAVTAGEVERLRESLHAFQPQLPPQVIVKWF